MRPLLVEDERDERVVAEFERLQAEHDRLGVVLDNCEVLQPDVGSSEVAMGSRVLVTDPAGQQLLVRIVDPVEAFLDEERISEASPLALAVLGRTVGQSCLVDAPSGPWTTTILAIGEEIQARSSTDSAGGLGSS
jgi:transcription elongation GreA/GreB family factor